MKYSVITRLGTMNKWFPARFDHIEIEFSSVHNDNDKASSFCDIHSAEKCILLAETVERDKYPNLSCYQEYQAVPLAESYDNFDDRMKEAHRIMDE